MQSLHIHTCTRICYKNFNAFSRMHSNEFSSSHKEKKHSTPLKLMKNMVQLLRKLVVVFLCVPTSMMQTCFQCTSNGLFSTSVIQLKNLCVIVAVDGTARKQSLSSKLLAEFSYCTAELNTEALFAGCALLNMRVWPLAQPMVCFCLLVFCVILPFYFVAIFQKMLWTAG